MIICLNQNLEVTKEKDGTYHLVIPGILNLHNVSPTKSTSTHYLLFEKGFLFVLTRDGLMVLRGELKSKDCLHDSYIKSSWHVFNPPTKKTYYYK